MADDTFSPQPTTIQNLTTAVYPSFAMLAGMQLDVFTPLSDGSVSATQLADALGVKAEKLSPLLYALVGAELLTVEDGEFANTPEANHFLVKGKPAYIGGIHRRYPWQAIGRHHRTAKGISDCRAYHQVDASLDEFGGEVTAR